MKALLIGCGSIGRRHLLNLLDSDRVESVAVLTGNDDCLNGIAHKGRARRVESIDDEYADFAVIANDTSRHLMSAIKLAARGVHIFMEKPVAHTLEGTDDLTNIVQNKGVKVLVGYNLRFLGALKAVKSAIDSGEIGKVYFARIEAGQYLPDWRTGRDYRKSYSASRERGGGVALDLTHEIDYMRWFFGDPAKWKQMKATTGALESEVEDVFEGIYAFPGNAVCSVHLDYLQKIPRRIISITSSNGGIDCDLINKRLTINERVVTDPDMFDVGRTYIDEIEHFLDVIEKGDAPAVTLFDGIMALRLVSGMGIYSDR